MSVIEVARTQVGDGSVIERLAVMETKLDHLTTMLEKSIGDSDGKHLDHEGRLRALERRMWYAAGLAMAGGGAVGSLLGPLLGT